MSGQRYVNILYMYMYFLVFKIICTKNIFKRLIISIILKLLALALASY